jgi:hypothetical protein
MISAAALDRRGPRAQVVTLMPVRCSRHRPRPSVGVDQRLPAEQLNAEFVDLPEPGPTSLLMALSGPTVPRCRDRARSIVSRCVSALIHS